MSGVGLALFCLSIVLHTATVIDVQANDEVTVAVEMGDTIYTARFPEHELKPTTVAIGDRIRAEAKGNKLTLEWAQGKKVSGRLIQIQRVLVHPHPE